jgi:hypothetical protein
MEYQQCAVCRLELSVAIHNQQRDDTIQQQYHQHDTIGWPMRIPHDNSFVLLLMLLLLMMMMMMLSWSLDWYE